MLLVKLCIVAIVGLVSGSNTSFGGASYSISIDFLKTDTISILTVKKDYDTASEFWGKYAQKCRRWNLTRSNIIEILKFRKRIDYEEFHYSYSVLPCSYNGYVLINKEKYFYTINPGSFSMLSREGKVVFYSCTNKNMKKYFILPPSLF